MPRSAPGDLFSFVRRTGCCTDLPGIYLVGMKDDHAAILSGEPSPKRRSGWAARRSRPWVSALIIALAATGLVRQFWNAGDPTLSYVLLLSGFIIACFMPPLGPIAPWADEPSMVIDTERSRAFLFTYATVAVLAMAGLWVMLALAALHRWDVLQLRYAIIALAFFLMTFHLAGPTLHASWRRHAR